MGTPFGARYVLDLGIKCDEADLADGDVVVIGAICPYAGTVKEIRAGVRVAPTTATLAVEKSAATNVNLLSTATVDVAAFVVHVAGAKTLSTSSAALQVVAGNMIVATWTLTDLTATDDAGYSCIVVIEPDSW
jgi:hypothetical protein